MARLTSAIISTLVDVITPVYVEKDVIQPQSFILTQNYPNPFNGSTSIQYFLPTAREVDLSLYNMLGEKVSTLSHGFKGAGTHSVKLNSDDFSSGIYLYVLRDGKNTPLSRKMIILK
jgi:hypothetical protein